MLCSWILTLNGLKTDSLVYTYINRFKTEFKNELMEKQPQDFNGGSQSRFLLKKKKKNISLFRK